MKLTHNMLLEWPRHEDSIHVERVLKLLPDCSTVITIRLNDPVALPVLRSRNELVAQIADGEVRILQLDPYAFLHKPEAEIRLGQRGKRDRAWDTISSLVDNPHIWNPRVRGPLISEAAARSGFTKKTVYEFLRRYWQGGQMKNALLPRFDSCGGKGKDRKASTKKRGRPSRKTTVTGLSTGVNVDAEMQERLLRGARKYFENEKKLSAKDAYEATLREFFNIGFEVRNGVWTPILPPAEELPTQRQFTYVYEKFRDPVREIMRREGERAFLLKHRQQLGDSTQMANGPGSLYQIDATIADIYLVSSFDTKWIIGRPVVYIVVDTWSRLIAGLAVGLEGPSWVGAMTALENAFSDKVMFCEEYGIHVGEDDWPAVGAPEALFADGGELGGYNADNLVNSLGIRMAIAGAYRPDMKAIVERNFGWTNDKYTKFLPGTVREMPVRGGPDYRLDAKLTLHEFRKLLITCVRHHNASHRHRDYPLDEEMIADRVEPYPLELWEWGIQNRTGHLKQVAPDILRVNLLPSTTASVTEHGVKVFGLKYSCDLALQEQWFAIARNWGRRKINVAYDPRLLDTVYLRLDGGTRLEACHLLEADRAFRSRDWHDIEEERMLKGLAEYDARTRSLQSNADYHAQLEEIVRVAEERAEENPTDESKSARVKGIREHRKRERQREADKDARKFAPTSRDGEAGQVVPFAPPDRQRDVAGGSPASPVVDKYRRVREEVWDDDE